MKSSEINIRDPYVFFEDGVYYMCGTTDKFAWGGPAEGFDIYKSRDLIDWEGPFPAFKKTAGFWASENFWAPELHKYNGRYYLFASFIAPGINRASQILAADDPLGPYKPLAVPFTPAEWYCLDATLYIEDGMPYAVFCREWLTVEDGEIYAVPLECGLKQPAGAPKLLFRASDASWTVPFVANGKRNNRVTDGPFLHRLKNGKLLMLWSSNGKEGYAMGMAVSDSGRILGDWRHIDKPLYAKDGGHGMLFRAADGSLMTAFHQPNTPSGAERPVFLPVIENGDILEIK